MPNMLELKNARILIADADRDRRFGVEKLLNQFGFYGVATAGSFDEVACLLGFPGRTFDAVLLNCALLDSDSDDTWNILHKQPAVFLYRNSLFTGRVPDPVALITEGFTDVVRGLRTLH